MIFNEIYGCYYDAVAKILAKASSGSINKKEMREIIEKHAFSESFFEIESKLNKGEYQLLNKDGTTPILNKPTLPLTELQKRWLKSISLDKRIKLFCDDFPDLSDTSPIFSEEDYYIYDKYSDGDDYENETYIKNFRTLLTGIKENKPVNFSIKTRNGKNIVSIAKPTRLEYSPKDDKFRVYTEGSRQISLVNLSNIVRAEIYEKDFDASFSLNLEKEKSIKIELYNQRNALERFMIQFAHYKKIATKIDEVTYHIDVFYTAIDETELVIRVLSFGHFVKVLSPDSFIKQIRYRINKQKLMFKENN